jgi:hypothetical protein
MKNTRRRHWVTTLLAVWMFADAALMLLWTINLLYGLWDYHHRPHNLPLVPAPRQPAGMTPRLWFLAIWENFRILLSFLPAPHLLLGLLQIPWVRHHVYWAYLNTLNIWFSLAVVGIAVALGYGLLRMREWARWSYAGLCVLAIVFLGGYQFGLFWPLTILCAFIMPIALLVFLFRRGLSVPPRGGSLSPAPPAKHSSK